MKARARIWQSTTDRERAERTGRTPDIITDPVIKDLLAMKA
jgi:hypothetical protein